MLTAAAAERKFVRPCAGLVAFLNRFFGLRSVGWFLSCMNSFFFLGVWEWMGGRKFCSSRYCKILIMEGLEWDIIPKNKERKKNLGLVCKKKNEWFGRWFLRPCIRGPVSYSKSRV